MVIGFGEIGFHVREVRGYGNGSLWNVPSCLVFMMLRELKVMVNGQAIKHSHLIKCTKWLFKGNSRLEVRSNHCKSIEMRMCSIICFGKKIILLVVPVACKLKL